METYSIIKEIDSNAILLDNLDDYIGKKVEITINVVDNTIRRNNIKLLRGSLKKYADPSLISKEKFAWELAVREKHDS